MNKEKPPWVESEGFRETFLHRFTRPEHRRTLMGLTEMLEELWLEAAGFWPRGDSVPPRCELEAAALDLRHLEGFLRNVGREHELSELSEEDQKLSRFAAELVPDVAQLAKRLETALTAPEGRPV